MEQLSDDQINQDRRELFKKLTSATAAGAIVAGVSTVMDVAVAKDINQTTNEKEQVVTKYRETQYVRDYYDSL